MDQEFPVLRFWEVGSMDLLDDENNRDETLDSEIDENPDLFEQQMGEVEGINEPAADLELPDDLDFDTVAAEFGEAALEGLQEESGRV